MNEKLEWIVEFAPYTSDAWVNRGWPDKESAEELLASYCKMTEIEDVASMARVVQMSTQEAKRREANQAKYLGSLKANRPLGVSWGSSSIKRET